MLNALLDVAFGGGLYTLTKLPRIRRRNHRPVYLPRHAAAHHAAHSA